MRNVTNAVRRFSLAALMGLSALSVASEVNSQYDLQVLAKGMTQPWGLANLGQDEFVMTERNGQIRLFKDGVLSAPISGLPDVYFAGQGGLLDVIADPNFAENRTLYFSMSVGRATENALQVVSSTLSPDGTLSNVKVLFQTSQLKKQAYHYAGRFAWLPDGSLIFGVGDGYFYMEDAQNLKSQLGKTIRITNEGESLADNPKFGQSDAAPHIYSYGHRNPQGMYYDGKRQVLWSVEHGPKGGDELNIIAAGKNYGWPVITYGVDYSGDIISELTHKDGMEQPVVQWTPSIAPSSVLAYYGEAFPEFQGKLLVTTLKFQELRVVALNDNNGVWSSDQQMTLLKDKQERLRDIEQDAKGNLYVVTDTGTFAKIIRK